MSGPRGSRRNGGRPARPAEQGPGTSPGPGTAGGPPREAARQKRSPDDEPRGPERLADLLPRAARNLGLERQLEQAMAAAAWEKIVAQRVPAAVGSCRLRSLDRGVATIEADLPIVGQEIRMRSTELLRALRAAVPTPIASLQVAPRHV